MAKSELKISKSDLKKALGIKALLDEDIEKLANELAEVYRLEVKKQILETNTIASGKLYRSITEEVLIRPRSVVISVGSPERYAKQANEGRPAGRRPAPIKILKWMKDKGVRGDIRTATKIADKIGLKGYKGKRYFDRAIEIVNQKIPTITAQIFRKLG